MKTDEQEICILDVKELYDAAYDLKALNPEKEEAFRLLMAEAVQLDMAYRRQLTKNNKFSSAPKPKEEVSSTHKDSQVA